MAIRPCKESESSSSSWSKIQLQFHGIPLTMEKELLVAKSSKLSALLKENPEADISTILHELPVADAETFKLLAKFCHGYNLNLSPETVIPLACVASSLGMTDSHAPNNLLSQTLAFFQTKILPSWNDSLKALRSAQNVSREAVRLGLIDACLQSLAAKAIANPHLLHTASGEDDSNKNKNNCDNKMSNLYRPTARKRLFMVEWKNEEVTTLPTQLFELLISAMVNHRLAPRHIAVSLSGYVKKWGFCKENHQTSKREVIEAVERLMPVERGLVSCAELSRMLRLAVAVGASSDCIQGLELRFGLQLDQAAVKDLLIPNGSSEIIRPTIESVRRLLNNFYLNYDQPDDKGIMTVASVVEDLLAELAIARDLDVHSFIQLAEMSTATVRETDRRSDGVYKAIDVYLDKHPWLSGSEREDLCRMLDCHKMSDEAIRHAAQNDRLPTRVSVQVLFVAQMRLKDQIETKDMRGGEIVEEGEDETARMFCGGGGGGETEMEEMGNKVMELERECDFMRRQIGEGKRKKSLWEEMKMKFNCKKTFDRCNCQVKRKKMRLQ